MSLPHCSSNYSDFASYLESNTPCIFPRDALCDRWPARKDWHVAHSRPAWDVLLQRYASDTVTVWEQPSGEQNDIPLHDALRLMTTTPETETPSSSIFYIKDWHLALFAERHHLTPFYTVPAVFQDDWMNDYYLSVRDEDFRFVYAGQKGSVTNVHRDVYGSYSWSTNIVGRKCWWLLAPEHAPALRRFPDVRTSEVLSDFRSVDHQKFPLFESVESRLIIVEQEEGETIFVPSGWYHMVLNLTDCISINHNWCNSHNILPMYNALKDHVSDVEAALYDVRDLLRQQDPDGPWQVEFDKIVQDVLRQDSGWDWRTFWAMIGHQLRHLTCEPGTSAENKWPYDSSLRPSKNHTLGVIRQMALDFDQLSLVNDDPVFQDVDRILCSIDRR